MGTPERARTPRQGGMYARREHTGRPDPKESVNAARLIIDHSDQESIIQISSVGKPLGTEPRARRNTGEMFSREMRA